MLKSIQLLAHSGFLLEFEKAWVIFDYFQDPQALLERLRQTEKPILLCSTHEHHDHWREEILSFPERYGWKNYGYILDHRCFAHASEQVQVRLHDLVAEGKLSLVQQGDVVASASLNRFGLQQIRVTGSTDVGSSFVFLTSEKELLFFAGDLNDWDWQDEDSPQMALAFAEELQKVKESLAFLAGTDEPILDWAFFPLDKRLGCKAEQGPLKFLSKIQVRHFIPMHLCEGYDLPELLQQKTQVKVLKDLSLPGSYYDCMKEGN